MVFQVKVIVSVQYTNNYYKVVNSEGKDLDAAQNIMVSLKSLESNFSHREHTFLGG
jgi:hypothetical protein